MEDIQYGKLNHVYKKLTHSKLCTSYTQLYIVVLE